MRRRLLVSMESCALVLVFRKHHHACIALNIHMLNIHIHIHIANSDWLMYIRCKYSVSVAFRHFDSKMSSVEQILDIGSLETNNGKLL